MQGTTKWHTPRGKMLETIINIIQSNLYIFIGLGLLIFIGLTLKFGFKLLQTSAYVIAIACGLKYLDVL